MVIGIGIGIGIGLGIGVGVGIGIRCFVLDVLCVMYCIGRVLLDVLH